MTPLAMVLFAGGLVLSAPAFWHSRAIWLIVAWDGVVLLLWLVDALTLPAPEAFTVTRSFLDSPQLGQPTRVELSVRMEADRVVDLRVTDDLHPALIAEPKAQRMTVYPRDPAVSVQTVSPVERGDFAMGRVFLRYRGALRLAERWSSALPVCGDTPLDAAAIRRQNNWAYLTLCLMLLLLTAGMAGWYELLSHGYLHLGWWAFALTVVALGVWGVVIARRGRVRVGGREAWAGATAGLSTSPSARFARSGSGRDDGARGDASDRKSGRDDGIRSDAQRVRVFPALEENRRDAEFYLLRARQIEMQKRRLRLRGTGRDFESLRDYQLGDELRNVSWTATARRYKLVTRQFTVERSQQVWIVLDAGRLSRTAFELRRGADEMVGETEAERDHAHLLTVTQLDQAASAAAMLAQVVNGSGDKFGMMAYGRSVQQLLMPGAGPAHVRVLVDLLSQTKSERAEADHLAAISRLKNLQRRRGLVVWVTELVDSVGRPEVVTAAAELVRRHLVVLVLLKHPELDELAGRVPVTRDEMFHAAAAQEMLERRREAIAQLERQGVLIVETTAAEVGVNTISKYLEVKAQGLL